MIERLSNDLLSEIFNHLSVRDIVRLRLVNVRLYNLTHKKCARNVIIELVAKTFYNREYKFAYSMQELHGDTIFMDMIRSMAAIRIDQKRSIQFPIINKIPKIFYLFSSVTFYKPHFIDSLPPSANVMYIQFYPYKLVEEEENKSIYREQTSLMKKLTKIDSQLYKLIHNI